MAKVTGPLFSLEAHGSLRKILTYKSANYYTSPAMKASPHTASNLDNRTIVTSTAKASAWKKTARQILWKAIFSEIGASMRRLSREQELKLCGYMVSSSMIPYNIAKILKGPAQQSVPKLGSIQFKCLLETCDDLTGSNSSDIFAWKDSHFPFANWDHLEEWTNDIQIAGAKDISIFNLYHLVTPETILEQEYAPGSYSGFLDMAPYWYTDYKDWEVQWFVLGTRTATASPQFVGYYQYWDPTTPPGHFAQNGICVFLKPLEGTKQHTTWNSSLTYMRRPVGAQDPTGYYYTINVPTGCHIHVYIRLVRFLFPPL